MNEITLQKHGKTTSYKEIYDKAEEKKYSIQKPYGNHEISVVDIGYTQKQDEQMDEYEIEVFNNSDDNDDRTQQQLKRSQGLERERQNIFTNEAG